MSGIIFRKVNQLPTVLEPNAVYIVLSEDVNSCEFYVTDSDGTIALPLKSSSNTDILTASSMYLMQLSSGS